MNRPSASALPGPVVGPEVIEEPANPEDGAISVTSRDGSLSGAEVDCPQPAQKRAGVVSPAPHPEQNFDSLIGHATSLLEYAHPDPKVPSSLILFRAAQCRTSHAR